MNFALLTVEIPPFRENSPWLWGLENLPESHDIDLVGISDREQFGQGDFQAGSAHLLNVFVDPETGWTRRELTEYSVKSYVYLSKLHRRDPYDRFIVVDCGGVEPLLVANLSVLADVWVVEPHEDDSVLGTTGRDLLDYADRRFERGTLLDGIDDEKPTSDENALRAVFDELLGS